MAPPPPGLMTGQEYIGPKDGQDSEKISPKLPRWSSGGDFTMDEDMARIMGGEAAAAAAMARHGQRPGKHGRNNSAESSQAPTRTSHVRSVSETARGIPSPLWSRSTGAEDGNSRTSDMISPTSTSSADDTAVLKRQLRNSEQKVAELERKFNTEADLKNLNKKLIEKRKTVSVLDSQAEIMIRQLEVLAGYVEKAKETKEPIDSRKLEDAALKEFVQKLEHVRMSMSESIEQLHEERNQLLEEKTQAMADRDRALMEFEQLSSKNAQLADMNNEMTHQLQERFRSQAAESKGMNGLGIYGDKAASLSSTNLENASMTTTLIAADDDSIMEGEPTVVHVRKGQIKKFNWKKGSKGLAQGLTKGVNRAVVAFQQNDRGERVQTTGLAGDNIGMPYNTTVVPVESPSATTPTTRPGQVDQSRQGFGFFRQKSNVPKPTSSNASLMPLAAEPPSTLFGSDLSERADYERRQIPSVVTRCIEEVELRGMDQEGIYRKTGGNSQVNTIKDGIDKSEDFDISDPDIDITAVTSVLKQYFRKLPIPLLSYDVYDRVLESVGKLILLLYVPARLAMRGTDRLIAIVDEKERCDHLRRTFDSLPDRHRDCLEFLMFHLDRVAQRQSENLVSHTSEM